jgi:hypothetical protein
MRFIPPQFQPIEVLEFAGVLHDKVFTSKPLGYILCKYISKHNLFFCPLAVLNG